MKQKSHFPGRVLDAAEHFQQKAGRTRLGSALVDIVAGSDSPAYRQLEWRSRHVTARRCTFVTVEGDKHARFLARNWERAVVLSAVLKEVDNCKAGVELHGKDYQEAIAYKEKGIVRVGALPEEGELFEQIDENNIAVALRLGRESVCATMGLWVPEDKAFVGIERVAVEATAVPIAGLPVRYPGVTLG